MIFLQLRVRCVSRKVVGGHIAAHRRTLLHLLLRRRTLVQTARQADLSVVLVAAIAAMLLSLIRVLSGRGLARHLGQVATTAVVSREHYAGVLVVADGVS